MFKEPSKAFAHLHLYEYVFLTNAGHLDGDRSSEAGRHGFRGTPHPRRGVPYIYYQDTPPTAAQLEPMVAMPSSGREEATGRGWSP